MKRTLFALILVLLISVVVHVPISFVMKYVPKVNGLTLANPSGSLWNGKFYTVQLKGVNLGTLSWDFHPHQLFLGKVDVSFDLTGESDISAKGNTGVTFSGAYARNVKFSITSDLINRIVAIPLPAKSEGSFSLVVDDYVVATPWCEQLIGDVTWNNAKLILPIGDLELGNPKATLACKNGSILLESEVRSNHVDSDIVLTFTPDNKYQIEGSLKPNGGLSQGIRDQLKWLGKPDADGRYPLSFKG